MNLFAFCFSEIQRESLSDFCRRNPNVKHIYVITEDSGIINKRFFQLDRALYLLACFIAAVALTHFTTKYSLFIGNPSSSRIQKILLKLAPYRTLKIGYDGTGTLLWLRNNPRYISAFVENKTYAELLKGSLTLSNDEVLLTNTKIKNQNKQNSKVVIIGQPFVEVGMCSKSTYLSKLDVFLKNKDVVYIKHRREKTKHPFRYESILAANTAHTLVGFSSTYFLELTLKKKSSGASFINLLVIPGEHQKPNKRFEEALNARALVILALQKKGWKITTE